MIVNYSDRTVFADSAILDDVAIYRNLGTTPGSPLNAVDEEGKTLPLVLEDEGNGNHLLRLYLSLKPRQHLRFNISPADAWLTKPAVLINGSWDAENKMASIRNGILEVKFYQDKKGQNLWNLSLEGPLANRVSSKGDRRITYDCLFSSAVTPEFGNEQISQNIIKNNPGFTPIGGAGTITKVSSDTLPDGSIQLYVERTYQGHAKDLVSKDYFTLVRGQPVLKHIMEFENRSQEPRFMPFISDGDWMDARVDPNGFLAGKRTMIPVGKLNFSEEGAGNVRPTLAGGGSMWMNVINDAGASLGMSIAKSTRFHIDTGWILQRNPNIKLASPDLYRGPFPLEISSQKPLVMGIDYQVFQGEVDAIGGMADLCALVKKETAPDKTPVSFTSLRSGKPFSVTVAGEVMEYASTIRVIDDFTVPERCLAIAGKWVAANGVARLESGTSESGKVRYAVTMDFSSTQIAELKVTQISLGASITVKAIPAAVQLVPSNQIKRSKMDIPEAVEPVILTQNPITSPGTVVLDISAATHWAGHKRFALEISVSGGFADFSGLALRRPAPKTPDLYTPLDGQELTDIAGQFLWHAVPQCQNYQIQLAADEKFTNPTAVPIKSVAEIPYYYPLVADRLKPGTYFWRVCAINSDQTHSDWSETRRVIVNEAHPANTKLVREVSPDHPLFYINVSSSRRSIAELDSFIKTFKRTWPREIVDHAAFSLGFDFLDVHKNPRDFREYLKVFDTNEMDYFWCGDYRNLPQIEWQYQNIKHCLGIAFGEHMFWLPKARGVREEDNEFTRAVMRLAAKYGKFYFSEDGIQAGGDKWHWMNSDPDCQAILKDCGKNIILLQKNNIFSRGFLTQGSILGMWLSGRVGYLGTHHDSGFYWQQAGMGKLGQYLGFEQGNGGLSPAMMYALTWIHGLNQGAVSFSGGDQLNRKLLDRLPKRTFPSAMQFETGEPTPWYERICIPLFKATIDHQLVPTRQQVLDTIKVAVFHDQPFAPQPPKLPAELAGHEYRDYWPLYAGTYGFRDLHFKDVNGKAITAHSERFAFFPTTGRYGYFPVLPYPVKSLENLAGRPIQNVAFEDLNTVAKVKTVFDQAYPQRIQGGALAITVGDLITVISGHENDDTKESFTVPLDRQRIIKTLAGQIGAQTYLVGKFEDGNRRLWFQANSEYDVDLPLTFTCDAKPVIQELTSNKLKSVHWDEAKKQLLLVINTKDGAVEFNILNPPSAR